MEPIPLSNAAQVLGVSEHTLKTRVARGEVQAIKIPKGKRLIWALASDVLADLLAGGKPKNTATYNEYIKEWEADQLSGYLTGTPLSPRTISRKKSGINVFWEKLGGPKTLERITVDNVRQAIAKAPIDQHETRRNIYFAMVSLFGHMVLKGLKPKTELLDIKEIPTPPVNKSPRRTFVTAKQFQKLIDVNESWLSCRKEYDRNLLTLFMMMGYHTGMRSSEICQVTLQDVDLKERVIHVRAAISKTGLERHIGITPELLAQVKDYLGTRPESNYDFLLLQKSGKPTYHRMFSRRIRRMLELKKIKFDITPHGFRRSLTTELLKEHPPAVVQKITGHTNIKTLQIYDMGTSLEAIDILRKPQTVAKKGKPKRKRPKMI